MKPIEPIPPEPGTFEEIARGVIVPYVEPRPSPWPQLIGRALLFGSALCIATTAYFTFRALELKRRPVVPPQQERSPERLHWPSLPRERASPAGTWT